MMTLKERSELARQVTVLVEEGSIHEAIPLVKDHPDVFQDLPESLRDNELLALAAMKHQLAYGRYASENLKSNIEFFIAAFQANFNHPPLTYAMARDLIFVLAFSRGYFRYFHEISNDDVGRWFHLSHSASNEEADRAVELLKVTNNRDRSWVTHNKEASIFYLSKTCPGFASCCYEYAYMWAHAEKEMDRIKHIW